jgi:hypothetical protein
MLQTRHYNRAGLSELVYRIGNHSTFLNRMLRNLSHQTIPDGPNQGKRPLSLLTTRASDDIAIALLDAWAVIADVLTFYQERISNESYLRTATERVSVLELARLVGYELNPGVAASTFLSFIVEDAPGAPGVAVVPHGTKIQSIPKQGQFPQTFETDEEIYASAEWNNMKPYKGWTTKTQKIDKGTKEIYLKGINTQLQPGDAILFVGDERETDPGSERWDFRIIETVKANPKEDYTIVTWKEGLGHKKPSVNPSDNPRVFTFRQRVALFGHNAPDWKRMSIDVKKNFISNKDRAAIDKLIEWPGFKMDPQNRPIIDPNYSKVLVDNWIIKTNQAVDNIISKYSEWPKFQINKEEKVLFLDAIYPKILDGSWVALMKPGYVEIYKITRTSVVWHNNFTLSGRVTRIFLDASEHLDWFNLRNTVVFIQSQELELFKKEVALTLPVEGDKITLDKFVLGLTPNKALILSGKRMRARVSEKDEIILEPSLQGDEIISEVVFIEDVLEDKNNTVIKLTHPLNNVYDNETVVIHGNVVRSTHGETIKDEVIGSGDGSLVHQNFMLKRSPLTYISSPTSSGSKSTLSVRVNGLLWQEVSSLYDLEARDQKYTVRIDNYGRAILTFGDGVKGSRLPSGRENIVATYRCGIGPVGEVGANSLVLLQTRPLGIRSATNPLPATGASSPEKLQEARTNAPLKMLTLNRIVSLQDYENFARSFAGIGKAKVAVLWNGETRLVHITIAASSGDKIEINSDLYINLIKAISSAHDPTQKIFIQSYQSIFFNLTAKILIDTKFIPKTVLRNVRIALLDNFGFEKRSFGQPVTAAEVVTVIQKISGVVATDMDQLYSVADGSTASGSSTLASYIPATDARWQNNKILPAQLLLINSNGIKLTGITT